MAEQVATEFLRHELARGRWNVHNNSNQFLEDVQVQVQFPLGIDVLMESDTDYCDHGGHFNARSLLPPVPAAWGTQRFDYPARRAIARSALPRTLHPNPEFELEETGQGPRLRWHVGDLRPQAVERGNERFAIVTDEHQDSLTVQWAVTARGINHVFEGQARIVCAQDAEIHLAWGRRASAEIDTE